MKSFTVKIDGKAYDCEVEEIAAINPSRTEKGKVFSPVSGKVLNVLKSQGEKVKKGEVFMVLDTPRIETRICAPRDGRIAITAVEGELIERGCFLALIND